MSLTAAASGFVVFLLSASVIQGKDGWGVTYTTEICALKGSTVKIRCTYRYPSIIKGLKNKVKETFWFIKVSNYVYVDLRTEPEYSGRVTSHCEDKVCTLSITDLRESDSAEYKFRFTTNQPGGKYFGSPGVSLSVTDLQVKVSRSQVYSSYNWAEFTCQSSCRPPGDPHYVWYKNGQKISGQTSNSYSGNFYPSDRFSCAVRGYEDVRSPSVSAPKLPSVSVSPSAEIVEGSSVTLTCSSDANPAANYFWYKKDGNPVPRRLNKEPQLVFSSIQSSDSGQYYCTAENQLGTKTSEFISIDVKYAPKLPSVSVSPSAEIVEGSSVTLNCSSDANPAANYTWYKEDQIKLQGPEGVYHFTSISSEDRGIYCCNALNPHGGILSPSLSVDVQYAPKLPSVSVSPSAEIVEGSSVTLTCSSDANPAANYTWNKEDEDSPKASGQIFIITDFRAEHSGNYYCEVQNNRGRSNSTLPLTVVAGSWKYTVAGTIPVVLLAVISLSVFLWIRKKRASRDSSEPEERPDNSKQCLPDRGQQEEQGDLQYASIHFSNNRSDPLYSNIGPARLLRHTEQQQEAEYTAVKFNRAPRIRGGEDPAALYSTVNKTR